MFLQNLTNLNKATDQNRETGVIQMFVLFLPYYRLKRGTENNLRKLYLPFEN